MKMSGGRAAVEALRLPGWTGYSGSWGRPRSICTTLCNDAKDIRHIGVRDERAGTHMAGDYGRITGIMIADQSGPGSTNLVTGLAQADLAFSPVVVITGLPLTQHIGKDSFQEIDQHTLFLPVTKKSLRHPDGEAHISAEELEKKFMTLSAGIVYAERTLECIWHIKRLEAQTRVGILD